MRLADQALTVPVAMAIASVLAAIPRALKMPQAVWALRLSPLPRFRLMHVPRKSAGIATARSLRWTTYTLSTGILMSTWHG